MNWMILPFKRYAEFSGRSRRMEYWMFVLLNVIIFSVLSALVFAGGDGAEFVEVDSYGDPVAIYGMFFSSIWGILAGFYWLVILIPWIAVNVRRLHDRDMSGWWFLGFVIGNMIPIVSFVISIAYLVVMALPGTSGANRFGPDPLTGGDAQTFE